jgi:hypothetical protein
MNTYIRDNLNYLKGINQVPTIESGLIVDNTDGDEYVKLPLLSTAESNSVLDAEGKIAWDETTHQVKIHNGTAVKAIISEADVDDTPVNGADTVPVSSNWAYDLKATLTTRGDVIMRGDSDWERLGLGTSGQYLSSNGTDVVWATGTATTIDTIFSDILQASNDTARDGSHTDLTKKKEIKLNNVPVLMDKLRIKCDYADIEGGSNAYLQLKHNGTNIGVQQGPSAGATYSLDYTPEGGFSINDTIEAWTKTGDFVYDCRAANFRLYLLKRITKIGVDTLTTVLPVNLELSTTNQDP